MAEPSSRASVSAGARPTDRSGLLSTVRAAPGFSIVELMFVLAISTVVMGMSAWTLSAVVAKYRAVGAVRFVSAQLRRAREEAVTRGTYVAVRFDRPGVVGSPPGHAGSGKLGYRLFVDGNGNGVSAQDIRTGVDEPLGPTSDLAGFTDVDFGVQPGQLTPDGGVLMGLDPVRFGASRMASFGPLGTSSAGSLYILGRRAGRDTRRAGNGQESQYVIRLFGDTGKAQAMRFDVRRMRWEPL